MYIFYTRSFILPFLYDPRHYILVNLNTRIIPLKLEKIEEHVVLNKENIVEVSKTI